WLEIINRDVLEKVPLFHGGDPVFLHNLAMMLRPVVYEAGETIINKGEMGNEMYVICRGRVEVLDGTKVLTTLGEGEFFGEMSLMLSQPRTATIRAIDSVDLFVLDKADFNRFLKDQPQFANSLRQIAQKRYHLPEGAWEA